MPGRAHWKGYLKLSLVSCPIALYPATSAVERISFRQINKRIPPAASAGGFGDGRV
jgi:non-homologous end joining protein Ku